MKKKALFLSIMVLAVAMIVMVSCSSSTLASETVDEHHIVITAEKAGEDDLVVSGGLEVGADQQIVIDSVLDEGGIKIEFISSEGFDDEEEVPDIDSAEVKYTANVNGKESQAVFFGEGEYMVRVTGTEKATGTVDIQVKGFGEE